MHSKKSLRTYLDYRELNWITIADKQRIFREQNLLDKQFLEVFFSIRHDKDLQPGVCIGHLQKVHCISHAMAIVNSTI